MIKRTPLEIPPPVARSFMSDMKAYHAENKRAQFRADVEPATALGWLRRHLSEIHRQRCGLICLSSATGLQYS